MKLIVAGSRTFDNYKLLDISITDFIVHLTKEPFHQLEIISGTAKGADHLGEIFAKKNHLKCSRFPANWDKYGKSAGYKRNEEMAKYADACICFWDGISRGTNHMINIAIEHELDLKIIRFR
jgi:hypothetical protein